MDNNSKYPLIDIEIVKAHLNGGLHGVPITEGVIESVKTRNEAVEEYRSQGHVWPMPPPEKCSNCKQTNLGFTIDRWDVLMPTSVWYNCNGCKATLCYKMPGNYDQKKPKRRPSSGRGRRKRNSRKN